MKSSAFTLKNMTIGELAKQSGVNAKLIRHYEEIGIIPKATRSESGYRTYSFQDVQFLRFVKKARGLGFSMAEIKKLLSLWRNKSRASHEVKRMAVKHIEELESKIREMKEMAKSLKELSTQCHGDNRPECPILDSLGNGEARENYHR